MTWHGNKVEVFGTEAVSC